jgi:hypothetical protein
VGGAPHVSKLARGTGPPAQRRRADTPAILRPRVPLTAVSEAYDIVGRRKRHRDGESPHSLASAVVVKRLAPAGSPHSTRLARPSASFGDHHDHTKLYAPERSDFCGRRHSAVDACPSRLGDYGGHRLGADVRAALAKLGGVRRFRSSRVARVHRVALLIPGTDPGPLKSGKNRRAHGIRDGLSGGFVFSSASAGRPDVPRCLGPSFIPSRDGVNARTANGRHS